MSIIDTNNLPAYKPEDFLEATLYEYINSISDPLKRAAAFNRLRSMTKELKVTGFMDLWQSYLKSLRTNKVEINKIIKDEV